MGYHKPINGSQFDSMVVTIEGTIVNENPTQKPLCFIVDDILQQHHAI
jgi:hypothetical protein